MPRPEDLIGVRVSHVNKSVEDIVLLPTVSFSVQPGTCVVVRGPNGSGKTTLLRIVAGLLKPSKGAVHVGDRTSDERDPLIRRWVSSLIGDPATYPDLTVADHLTFLDATWGGDGRTCEARVNEYLEQFRIGGLRTRFPPELSSGERQLFFLSLVLFRPASLLVLDEPEQRLDAEHRDVLGKMLAEEREARKTILMASHDEELIRSIGCEQHVLVG